MLMSHKHRFIFIHIHKTAGTSVTTAFVPYARPADRLAYEFRLSTKLYRYVNALMGWHNAGMVHYTGYHKHAKAFEIAQKLGEEAFGNYYTFAFVRNPFDLLVSLYYYLSQEKNHPLNRTVSTMNFSEFVKWHLRQNPPLQIEFLMSPDRERRLVDYVGRFETLQDDVDAVAERLRLDISGPVRHQNPSLKRENRSYASHYDDETRMLVEAYFKADFDMLGYDFEGFRDGIPLMGHD